MSSVSDESAIISIEVELKSKVSTDITNEGAREGGFFKEAPDDLRDIIKEVIDSDVKDAVDEVLEGEGVDLDEIKNLTKLVKDLDSKAIGNLTHMAKSPEGFVENTMMRVLGSAGPYGALAAAIITAIAGSPELVKAVVSALGVKGGPLNQDYAFTEDEQFNQQFNRQVQFDRLTGDNPVITLQTKGFVAGDKDFVDNSLVDVDLGRTARVGLRESSLGIIHGI